MNATTRIIAKHLQISIIDALTVQAVLEELPNYPRMTFTRTIEYIWKILNKK